MLVKRAKVRRRRYASVTRGVAILSARSPAHVRRLSRDWRRRRRAYDTDGSSDSDDDDDDDQYRVATAAAAANVGSVCSSVRLRNRKANCRRQKRAYCERSGNVQNDKFTIATRRRARRFHSFKVCARRFLLLLNLLLNCFFFVLFCASHNRRWARRLLKNARAFSLRHSRQRRRRLHSLGASRRAQCNERRVKR